MSIQLVKPKDYTPTESVLHDMFPENTGKSMGDSGGDGNRHWQRNQEVVDFRDRESFTYSYDGKYFDISKDLFHHLCDALEYDQLATIKWERWVNANENKQCIGGVEEYLGMDNKPYQHNPVLMRHSDRRHRSFLTDLFLTVTIFLLIIKESITVCFIVSFMVIFVGTNIILIVIFLLSD